jgi:hypothetical protein
MEGGRGSRASAVVLHKGASATPICRRDKGHHLRAIEPFAYQNCAVLIHTYEVKHLFCHVDTDDAKLLHGTRLLWLNDFTRLAIILAHCSRSAQGAGPFHYDQQAWLTRGVIAE